MLAAVIEFLALRVLAGSLGIVVAWEAWGRWLCVRISTGSLGIVVAWESWDAGFVCVSPLGLWGSWLRGRRGTWEAWDVGGVGRGRRGAWGAWGAGFGCVSPLGLWGSWGVGGVGSGGRGE